MFAVPVPHEALIVGLSGMEIGEYHHGKRSTLSEIAMSQAGKLVSHRICKDGSFVNPQRVICESSIVIYE